MPSDQNGLCADAVWFAYGQTPVVRGASIRVNAGESLALAGPNGSGKTTLLKLLIADLRPSRGAVTLDNQPLTGISPRERARHLGVVPQHLDATVRFPVRTLVRMGRAPYINFFGSTSSEDEDAVDRALAAAGLEDLAGRRFDLLSGGEQQRVVLAMALAQETRFLLLDEPTVHLDLRHQFEMLELLRQLQAERGIGLLAILHDLNLAALYFDRLALMHHGRIVVEGPAPDVVADRDALSIFRVPLNVVHHPDRGVAQVLLRPGDVSRK
jgi:iron complex transport system ATP-binding protein